MNNGSSGRKIFRKQEDLILDMLILPDAGTSGGEGPQAGGENASAVTVQCPIPRSRLPSS